MKTISVLCPTRQRAQRAYSYMLSVFDWATHKNRVELWFYVDSDDPELEIYKDLFGSPVDAPYNVELVVGPPISVSKSWNILAEKCRGDILFMGNDDLVHVTAGWDDKLEEVSDEYPDEIYCIFFDDGINSGKHCAFPGVSRKWFSTLGYFTPGIFEFGYNDTWIFDIAKRLGRVRYIPEILVRHEHHSKTRVMDATTKRHRQDVGGARWKRDKAKYEGTDAKRVFDAELLRSVMNG